MPTSPTSHETGKANAAPRGRAQAAHSKQPARKGAPRRKHTGAPGSPSVKNPERKVAPTGGSPSAAGQRRKVAGAKGPQGSPSTKSPGKKGTGSAGSHAAARPRKKRVATGAPKSGAPSRTGRINAGSTAVHRPASTGQPKVSRTGSVGVVKVAEGKKVVVKDGAPKHSASAGTSRIPIPVIVGIVVVAIAMVAGGFFLVRSILHPYEGAKVPDGQSVTVVIPEGSDGATIIQTLLDAGVIHNSKDFRKATANQNADQSLRSGTYTFKTGSDPADVVRQLVKGPNSTEGKLQVPEGLNVKQTAQVVEDSLGISAADFIQQAKASNYVDEFSFLKEASNDSLEGFLYPKTYDVANKDAKADDVIRLMLQQFEREISALDTEGARAALFERYGLNSTNYDIIKVASIIEEEARNDDDRAKVSSVFYNRLSSNMALQSDATISYETGTGFQESDLTQDSPYNTYLYKGLPPTPICSPSEWAIDAAMHPADTDYLFFFIIEDGTYSNHTFSKTFEEHDAAYAIALQEQAAASSGAEAAGSGDATGMGTTGTDIATENAAGNGVTGEDSGAAMGTTGTDTAYLDAGTPSGVD